MTDPSKIKPSHTQRAAYVYIRQSTPGQVAVCLHGVDHPSGHEGSHGPR